MIDVESSSLRVSEDRSSSAQQHPSSTIPSLEFDQESGRQGHGQDHGKSGLGWQALVRDVLWSPVYVYEYYRRLANAFSWKFVLMVMVVYGLNQGLGEAFFMVATRYFFTDSIEKGGLNLEADRYQAIDGFANVPWQMKSVYGVISDTYPINGLHRTPYILMSAIVGVFAWSGLWILPVAATGAGLLYFLGNLSVASPDVMIDASVAERCQTHPRYASDLQTLCWSSFGIGKIFGATAGPLYHIIGSRQLYALTALTSLPLGLAGFGYLMETPREPPTSTHAGESVMHKRKTKCCGKLREKFQDPTAGPLYTLSILVLSASMGLGLVAENVENDLVIFLVAVAATVFVSYVVFRFENKIDSKLAKASVFIFVSRAIQPSSVVMFYFTNGEAEGNHCDPEDHFYDPPRPCFSPEFYSMLEVIGYVVFLVGTGLYNGYISEWSYKRIWTSTQILLAGVGLLDFVLVMRWNVFFGISDKWFMIGDEILSDLIGRLNTMPLFVLAAAICPPGVEATLFAMNMGLSNMGGTIGGYFGLGLMYFLGGIKKPEFRNIGLYVIIRSLCRLLPILLIPFLVPDGSPRSEESEPSAKKTNVINRTGSSSSVDEQDDDLPLIARS